jgi:hypothetical protein
MNQAEPPQDPFLILCSHCKAKLKGREDLIGKKVRCSLCNEVFQAQILEDPGDSTQRPQGEETGGLCPVCQEVADAGPGRTRCPECGNNYHAECWDYNGGCGVYGCSRAPSTEHLEAIEIPAAYWGKEDKECPACGQTILAAAMRCRYCGATFESAAPIDSAEYGTRSESVRRRASLKTGAIWCVVLGVLPCTAPFVAVFGLLWYSKNYQEIGDLPSFQGAAAKIGIGVAVLQTLLLVVGTMISGLIAD